MFKKFPEFITDDTRYHDPNDPTTNSKETPRGQLITFEKSERKHSDMLPPDICENSNVLDLGSCVSASGAWVLEHGAMFYTGVEISKHNYDIATKNLKKYFSPSMWTLYNQPVLEWFKEPHEPYDVVLAAGILYIPAHENQIQFLNSCAAQTKKYLIIESIDTSPLEADLPISVYKKINVMKTGPVNNAFARCSNIPFLDMVLTPLGFELHKKVMYPEHKRFAAVYSRNL